MTLQFKPPVIGHRGACAYAPENTMASFIKAAQLTIKWVEFDVMPTSDGVPIIFHDETLNRTTDGRGLVSDFPYTYLRSLDAGKWFNPIYSGEHIPTLATVLEFLQEMKMSANIEIKASPALEASLISRVIKDMQPLLAKANDSFLFSSFSFSALELLRKTAPECQLGMLLHEYEPRWKVLCQELNCVSVHVNNEIITEKTAHEIKSMGKKLLIYTVNDPLRSNDLYSWGVDAVFSDVPDLI